MSGNPALLRPGGRAVRLVVLPVAASVLALSACTGDDKPSAAPATSSSAAESPTTTTTSPAPGARPTAALTGLPENNAAVRARSVIAVKIDNAPEARPQVAVDQADLVVEEPVEGGLTRLMAVFQSKNPGETGPVRSARVTDVSLVRAFGGGALVYSGSSSATRRRIAGTPHVILVQQGQAGDWRRDHSRRAPHNLMVDQASVRSGLGRRLSAEPQRQFSFSGPLPGGRPVKKAHVAWNFTNADWVWHAKGRDWLRYQNRTKDKLANGKQLAFDNVVIMQVRTRTDPGLHDVNGVRTPLPDLFSGGRVWLLRDGKVHVGTWGRDGVDDPLTFRGANGADLGLKPGQTWIELLPAPSTPKLMPS